MYLCFKAYEYIIKGIDIIWPELRHPIPKINCIHQGEFSVLYFRMVIQNHPKYSYIYLFSPVKPTDTHTFFRSIYLLCLLQMILCRLGASACLAVLPLFASDKISVRLTRALPAFYFRSHLTMGTLDLFPFRCRAVSVFYSLWRSFTGYAPDIPT